MTDRDLLFTAKDRAWLASKDRHFVEAQDRHIQAFGELIDTAHLEARAGRLLKDAESLKAQLMEHRRGEAIERAEFVCSAIEDLRDEI